MLSHRLTSLLSKNTGGKLCNHTSATSGFANNVKYIFTSTVRRDICSKPTSHTWKQSITQFFRRHSSSDAARVRRMRNAGTAQSKEIADIKLFSNDTMDLKMKIVSLGGIYMAFLIGQSTDIVYRFLSMSKPTVEDESYPWYFWWRKFNFHSEAWKMAACTGIIVSAVCVFAFAMFYPQRVVREVVLLKGRQTLRFTTCKSFGRTDTFEVPVKNVSAVMTLDDVLTSTKATYPLSIKGKRFFYQFHVKKGIIHDRKMFEDVLVRPRIFQ